MILSDVDGNSETPKDFVLNERSLGRRVTSLCGCERRSLREFTIILRELWTIAEALEIDNDTEDDSISQSIMTQHKVAIQNTINSFTTSHSSLVSVSSLPKSTTPHLTPLTLLETSASYLMNTSPFLTRSHLSPDPAIIIFVSSVHASIPKQPLPSSLPLFTPSLIAATLFITTCPSIRSPGSNRSRTLLYVLLSKLPNPVTSLILLIKNNRAH